MRSRHALLPEARRQFAANLSVLLTEKGLLNSNDKALSRQITAYCNELLHPSTLYNWRKGICLPRQDWFDHLADWLDCEPDDLLPPQYQNMIQKRIGK